MLPLQETPEVVVLAAALFRWGKEDLVIEC